jgi:hypothetical protein
MAIESNSGSPVSCIAPRRWDSGSSLSSADFSVGDMSSSKKPTRSILKKKGNRSRSNGGRNRLEFNKKNEIFDVEHLDDMTPQEISNIWYDPKEYAEIKSSYQVTIFLMETAESNDKPLPEETDEHTIRGLEYRTQTGAWARYEKKRDAYNAVLDEQDRQWKVDCDDHERLSEVYLQHSSKCCAAAYQRGVEDAAAAREICASLYKTKKKSSSSSSSSNKVNGITKESSRGNTSISSKNCENDSRLSKEGLCSSRSKISSSSRPLASSVRDSIQVCKDRNKSIADSASSTSSDSKGPSRGVSRTKSTSSNSGSSINSTSSSGSIKSSRKTLGTVAV